MAVPHYNYYPVAGSVVDASDGRVSWNGRQWMLKGKQYKMPSSHRLIGRAGGPLSGWTYDWKQKAWMEPSAPPVSPAPVVRPTPRPAPQPVPPTQISTIKQEVKIVEKKSPLESLIKHPVAPVVGGVLVVASYLTDEPVPPTFPAGLSEATAQQWQMVYNQNQQRFARRMELYKDMGMVLLGYSSAQTILDALPGVATNDNGYARLAARKL
jgi:hypothetical protein